MRIFITGVDGYLGWPLAQYLASQGHDLAGADLSLRRQWVSEMGSWSATPIATIDERLSAFRDRYGSDLTFSALDLRNYEDVKSALAVFQPDAIVHLGECPSAPFSMIDVSHAVFVQTNNLSTTFNVLYAMKEVCPAAHLIKLGTMGEYGTPNLDIPEGFFEIEYQGRHARLPFPRQAGSWYHWSKVHGSNNIMFACNLWGIRATDVMQGVVFGSRISEMGSDRRMLTRLDFDEAFGTIINRFCCQAAVDQPLTVYGTGRQRRGFIPIADVMQCLTLALENPPDRGEYRVFNQFACVYSVEELALKVQEVAASSGLSVTIAATENPRCELEDHYYNPSHSALLKLGYKPNRNLEAPIRDLLEDAVAYRGRIESKKDLLLPSIRWDGRTRKVNAL